MGVWGLAPIKQNMANPEGAKAGEPYQNFDGEGFPSESTKAPFPGIGKGVGEKSRDPIL